MYHLANVRGDFSYTQFTLITLKANLSFGGIESENPPPDLDLCARFDDEETYNKIHSLTQPDTYFSCQILHVNNLAYLGFNQIISTPRSMV